MANKRFSDFTDGSQIRTGDIVVGLRSGVNYRFNFPSDGIQDGDGNYIYKYFSNVGAVNYLQLNNAVIGNGPTLTADGDDADINLNITAKGTGNIVLDGQVWPNSDGTADQVLTTDGSGNLSWETESATGDVLAQVFQMMGA